jgi:hypothetical protein
LRRSILPKRKSEKSHTQSSKKFNTIGAIQAFSPEILEDLKADQLNQMPAMPANK